MLSSTILKNSVAKNKDKTQMEDKLFKVVQLMTKMTTYHTNNKNVTKLFRVSDKYNVWGLLVNTLLCSSIKPQFQSLK